MRRLFLEEIKVRKAQHEKQLISASADEVSCQLKVSLCQIDMINADGSTSIDVCLAEFINKLFLELSLSTFKCAVQKGC